MNPTTATRRGTARISAALTTSVLVVAGLSGCASTSTAGNGSPGSPSSAGSVGSAGTRAMTIQFVNPLPSYPTWRQVGDCMKKEATKRGAMLSESGPTGQAIDTGKMIQQVQQATANKKDAIVTFPASDGFTQVLKQAQAKGIITGTFYGPGGNDSGSDVNAAPDFGQIGSQLVTAVAKLPGTHVLGLVAAGSTGIGKLWLDGVKAAAAKTDNVTIAGQVYTGDDAAKALPQVTALLTAHPTITEILTHMGTTTPGAVSAIKSLGRTGKTFLLAGGHDNGGSEALTGGTANLMLMQNVCALGTAMVDGVVDKHEGKPTDTIPVSITVVDQAQLQKHLSEGWV